MWARPRIDEIQDEVAQNVIGRQPHVVGGSDRLLMKPEIPPPEVELSEAESELARIAGSYVGRLISELIEK